MRILLVVTHGNAGGAQQNVVSIARGMAKKGHDVFVLSGEGMWLIDQLGSAGVMIIPSKQLERSWNPLKTFGFMRELRQIVRENEIDVVHFHSSNAIVGGVGVPKNVKRVATIHGWSLLTDGWSGSGIKKTAYAIAMKTALRAMDEIVFVCNTDRRKYSAGPAHVVHNGINMPRLHFYPREAAREHIGVSNDEILIGTLARRAYAKNLDLFDELASKFSDYRFVNLADAKGDPVRLLPALDAFVLTSRFEGFPYVLLEAGAAGVPIVSSDVGGIPELIDGETGILATSNDYVGFVRAIGNLMNGLPAAQVRSARLRERIDRDFSESAMIDKLEDVYRL